MNKRSEEDAVFQDSQTEASSVSEDNIPTGKIHVFMMGHMGHQDVASSRNKRMKPFVVFPIMLIIMVALHILATIFLSKTGSGAFSFSNPISYVMIGLLFVFAMFKLKHLLGFMRRTRWGREFRTGVSSTGSVSHEQGPE